MRISQGALCNGALEFVISTPRECRAHEDTAAPRPRYMVSGGMAKASYQYEVS
jgi:hypothetical protein